MSQHGDGGIVGTKPYVSTGNYINRMSHFCRNCNYNYKSASGEDACPFSALYRDFLNRHYDQFRKNGRMALQMKNVDKKRKSQDFEEILSTANRYKRELSELRGFNLGTTIATLLFFRR